MLAVAVITALILLAALVLTTWRALGYIRQHPELLTDTAPPAYARCQETLRQIVARYQLLEALPAAEGPVTWRAPSGLIYDVSEGGITERRERNPGYHLRWPDIGGVACVCSPASNWSIVTATAADNQFTVDYAVYLLIVPLSGRTLNVPIPTDQGERRDHVRRAHAGPRPPQAAPDQRVRVRQTGSLSPEAPQNLSQAQNSVRTLLITHLAVIISNDSNDLTRGVLA